MADGIVTNLEGADELLAKLQTVNSDMQLKGGRFALRKASIVVKDAIEESARGLDTPNDPEQIFRNVTLRWGSRAFKATGDLTFRIGFLGGARSSEKNEANPGGDTWYWRLVEFGTSQMAARPFIRPAVQKSQGRVAAEFILQYGKALDRAIRRAAKQRARS